MWVWECVDVGDREREFVGMWVCEEREKLKTESARKESMWVWEGGKAEN